MPILAKKKKIIFSDEAYFDLGGYVNKRNCRIWGIENLHAYIEKPTHPKRRTVWYGFWSTDIIGPFFLFEIEQGDSITVNGYRYRAMLNEFVFTKIEQEDIGNIWFQQDGARCHTAEATLVLLRPVFEDRIISRRTVLRATQPKLHSMFCAVFLKIALSAAELMPFGHLRAKI